VVCGIGLLGTFAWMDIVRFEYVAIRVTALRWPPDL
jgi:hypothetical protein